MGIVVRSLSGSSQTIVLSYLCVLLHSWILYSSWTSQPCLHRIMVRIKDYFTYLQDLQTTILANQLNLCIGLSKVYFTVWIRFESITLSNSRVVRVVSPIFINKLVICNIDDIILNCFLFWNIISRYCTTRTVVYFCIVKLLVFCMFTNAATK